MRESSNQPDERLGASYTWTFTRFAMPTTARRGRRVTPATLWACVAAALVVHVTVLGTVEALDLSVVGQGMSTRRFDENAVAAEALKSNCASDAMFASTARAALCFAPWQSDVDTCLHDSEMTMYMDLS